MHIMRASMQHRKCGMRVALNEGGLFKTDTTKSVFIHLYNKLAQFKCQAIKGFIHILNTYRF